MPRAKKVCKRKGCPEFAVVGSLCQAHYREMRSVDDRPSSAERGYDAQWLKVRDA